MRKEINLCDNCGKKMEWGCPVNMTCGYGSIFDDMNLDFCSDECCANFILRKQEECKSGKGYSLEVREKYEKQLTKLTKSIELNKQKEKEQ